MRKDTATPALLRSCQADLQSLTAEGEVMGGSHSTVVGRDADMRRSLISVSVGTSVSIRLPV